MPNEEKNKKQEYASLVKEVFGSEYFSAMNPQQQQALTDDFFENETMAMVKGDGIDDEETIAQIRASFTTSVMPNQENTKKKTPIMEDSFKNKAKLVLQSLIKKQ